MSQQVMKSLFCRISKVDEEKRTVTGIGASEAIDDDGEIFDYDSSKPYVEAWSDSAQQRSQGKSFGNIREMHQLSAAGKLSEPIIFDDGQKLIILTSYVSDDDAWSKCLDGTYTGYSIRGPVVGEKWADPMTQGVKRYTCAPIEFSLVDVPCNPDAVFTAVKAGGITEERSFRPREGDMDEAEKGKMTKTKKVDGEDLPKSAFAYQGSDEPKDWHLPIEFSTNELSANHIRDAISRWDQTSMPDGAEKKTARARILAAAKKHGIDVSEESLKALGTQVIAKATTEGIDRISKCAKALGDMGDCLQGKCDHAGIEECAKAIGAAHKKATKALSLWADPDDDDDSDSSEDDSDEDDAPKKAAGAATIQQKGKSPETGAEDMTEAEKAQVAAAETNSAKALEIAEKTNAGMEQIAKALAGLTNLIAGEPVAPKSVTGAAPVAVTKAQEIEGKQPAAGGVHDVAKSIRSNPHYLSNEEAALLHIGR